MKYLLFIGSFFLLLATLELPYGYYTFLRILITITSVIVIFHELDGGINLWVIAFGLIAILFNPIFPVYLHDKELWLIPDLASASTFLIKAFKTKS